MKKSEFVLQNLLNRLIGNHSTQPNKSKRRKSGRTCRIEELESREMLSVTPFATDYDDVYTDEVCPEPEYVQTASVSAAASPHSDSTASDEVDVKPMAAPAPAAAAGKISSAKQSSSEKALTAVTLTWKAANVSNDVTFRITNTATGKTDPAASNSLKIEGLEPGKTHTFTVVAVDVNGNAISNTATVKAKTLTPKQAAVKSIKLAAGTKASLSDLTLSWKASAAADVTSYSVKYIGSDGKFHEQTVAGRSTAQCKVDNLLAGAKTKFEVIALTSTVSQSTAASGTVSTAKAALPKISADQGKTTNGIPVKWTSPSTFPLGYTLEKDNPYDLYYRAVSSTPAEWTLFMGTIANQSARVIGLPQPNANYEFMVVANLKQTGQPDIKAGSKPKTIKTANLKTGTLDEIKFTAASEVSAVQSGDRSITVTWKGGNDGEFVRILRNGVVVQTIASKTLQSNNDGFYSWVDNTLPAAGTDNFSYVIESGVGLEKPKTTVETSASRVSLITVSPPTDVSAVQTAAQTVTFTWTGKTGLQYDLEIGGQTFTVSPTPTGSTTYSVDVILEPSTTPYDYTITAYAGNVRQTFTGSVSLIEDTDGVKNVKVAQKPGELAAVITWDEIADPFFYQISIWDGSTEYTWMLYTNSLDTSEEESDDDDWFIPIPGVEYEITITAWDSSWDEFETTVTFTFEAVSAGTKHVIDFEFLAGDDYLGLSNAWPNNLAWNGGSAYDFPEFLKELGWNEEEQQYFIEGIGFTCNMSYWEAWDFYSWSGFGLSTDTNTTYTGYDNEMSSITGTGAYDSQGYGIAYGSGLVLDLPSGALIDSIMVTNTVYSHGSMTIGDSLTGGPLGAGDYQTLVIVGLGADGGSIGDVRFDMGWDGDVIDVWHCLDLSSLSGAGRLQFSFDSNVANEYGLLFPTYFAFDDIVYYTA